MTTASALTPPAILLGGHGPSLSIARSLGRRGIHVYVLGDRASEVRYSRHCATFVDLGSGDDVQERWLEWLRTGPRGAVVLACHDDGLELVARNRSFLESHGYVPVEADDGVMLDMLDKERSYELARRAGVPAPRTWSVGDERELETAAAEAAYPCALKPRHSHRFARRFDAKVLLAADEDELRAGYRRTGGLEMLVTEIVTGSDDRYCSYYTYVDADGRPLFHFTKRKPRQHPIRFGSGTYHVTDWSPDVAEMGLRFVQGVGLRGLACVEFKRDGVDGSLKLIECNARFTAANSLVAAAGVDLGYFVYEHLLGRSQPPPSDYRRGERLWYPRKDVRGLQSYRRSGELTLRSWLATLWPPPRLPIFAADDLLPSAVNAWWTVRRWARRAAAELRRRGGAA